MLEGGRVPILRVHGKALDVLSAVAVTIMVLKGAGTRPERRGRIAQARAIRAEQPLVHGAREEGDAKADHVDRGRRAEPLRRVNDQRHAMRLASSGDRFQIDERAVAPMARRQRRNRDGAGGERANDGVGQRNVHVERDDAQLAALILAQPLPLHHIRRVLVLQHEHAS